MLITVSTFDALVSAVQSEAQRAREIHTYSNGPMLIAFDGWACAGKTYNACRISQVLDCAHVDLDRHINMQMGTILEHVRYAELYDALRSTSNTVSFSGACMQAALERLNFDGPIVKVYVKRKSGDMWADSDKIYPEGDMTIEQFWHSASDNPREREMASYHQDYRPDETSDICYLRRS